MIFVSSIWPPPCDSQYRFNLVPWRRLLRNGADNKKVEVAVAHSRKMEQRNNYQQKLEDPPFPEVDQGLFSGMWRAVYFMGLIWFNSDRKLPLTYIWLVCYFDTLTKIIDISLPELPSTFFLLRLLLLFLLCTIRTWFFYLIDTHMEKLIVWTLITFFD